ncbi:PREDICTED: cytochrome P450 4C1-like [Trachymyrmex cornetzi]|uniref:cytochrome P450 4C1-like n=1 Tax=Trachymyrmex cornetzi TaxID=471704 RepID=UPI00084F0E07|nr:PREDICTED: cytochrome P450 4C1-like [Trachymyrmex cornetzi]
MFVIVLLSFVFILLVCNYYVHYGKIGRLINLIPGPLCYPIIGSVYVAIGSRETLWKRIITVSDKYYPIFKIWAFFVPTICIRYPDDLETILSNSKHIKKSILYDGFKPWIGTSILISEGAKWHSQRKILTPTFNFNILQRFVEIFDKESKNMIKSLENAEGTVVKNLSPFMSEHTLNALCETAMGISLKDLGEFQQQYLKAVRRMGELFVYRTKRQWLHSNWIFSLTPKGREQAKILKILHGFTERIIAERKLYHEQTNGQYLKSLDNDTSAEEDGAKMIGTRRKGLAMLDLLIAASREGLMTDLEIRQEVDTIMFEGHDTTASSLCFILALLAEHKAIQDRVRNEVNIAMQENEDKLTMKFLHQLSYLERCIKEALRLHNALFLISRICGEDVKLQSYLVPAGTILFIDINNVHKDPNFWPNPEIFDPDRFLPDRIRNRHPYSYVPFSAGPRNCIGQRYAMLQMKMMVASLIHHFYLEPVDYIKDVRLQVDLVVHPHPLRVRFVPVLQK